MSKVLLFGDICPTQDYRDLFNDGRIFSHEIIQEINSANYVVGNLECPATSSKNPIIKTGPNLKANPQDIRVLASLGFNAFSLANNHILDYGHIGIDETMTSLELNGLQYFGAGRNINEARKPLIIEIGKKKVGFLSFAEAEFNLATKHTAGANHFDIIDSFDEIKRIKSSVDYLIVLYHGGIEYFPYPSPFVQRKCRKMVDCGADLVSIQHSHCIGTIERYCDGLIIYGQGNSVFGLRPKSRTWNQGLLVALDTDANTVDFKPIQATSDGVVFSDQNEKKLILNDLYLRSEKLSDYEWIEKSWIEFCMKSRALTLPQLLGWGKWFIRLNRILGNRLIDCLYPKSTKMITMNLLRCEAHHEVMRTILENEVLSPEKKC